MLVWKGQGNQPVWFTPDRMENFDGIPEGFSLEVYTQDGVPVCGRYADAESPILRHILNPGWVWE